MVLILKTLLKVYFIFKSIKAQKMSFTINLKFYLKVFLN